MKYLIIIVIIFSSLMNLNASIGEAGVTLPILDYTPGARAMGIGGAFTALSDDVTSIYWNPAGLARMDKQEIYAMFEELFQGTSYWLGGYAIPFYGIGTFGVGLISLNTGNIVGTGPLEEDLGIYSDTQTMMILSYGTALNNLVNIKSRDFQFLDVGASLKLIKHSIYNDTAYGVALDLGTKYVPPSTSKIFRDFIFALEIQNLVPPVNKMETESEWYPATLKLGVCYRTLYDTLLISADMDQILFRSNSPSLNFGLEYLAWRILRMRMGYQNGFTGGLGIGIEDFSFDYALNYNSVWGLVNQFSVSFKFGSYR